MDRPLLISSIIEHAAAQNGETEIVSRETHGPVFRYSVADCARRVGKQRVESVPVEMPPVAASGEEEIVGEDLCGAPGRRRVGPRGRRPRARP